MKYKVSDKVQQSFDQLVQKESVLNALHFMEDDQENIIQKQMELTLIPAPTFQEEKKAQRFLEMFQEEGLEDCHIDEYGNASGLLVLVDQKIVKDDDSAYAELIINIQTGKERIIYAAVIVVVIGIIAGLIIYNRKK